MISFLRLKNLVFLHLQHLPMPSRKYRPLFAKWGGVNVLNFRNTFIGENVVFDTNYPNDIIIEEKVTLTVGCTIVTHFVEVRNQRERFYSRGKVRLCEGAYIGANTIICKPVEIGKYSIVGAGSVVTKSIPPYEIWAGNPAKFIKKRKVD